MKYLAGVLVLVALVTGCGGGGNGTPTAPSYPSVAGVWNGMLVGATPELSASVRLTFEQWPDLVLGMQRISGVWTGTIGSRPVHGNFDGGVGTDGQVIFTLVHTGPECNFRVDARVSGNRLTGTYGTIGPMGCIEPAVSPIGRVELTKE